MRSGIIVGLLICGISTVIHGKTKASNEDLNKTVSITEVQTENSVEHTIIHVQLNAPPTWTKIEDIQDHSSFTQILLKDTIAGLPGKFWDAEGPAVAKVGIFQSTETSVGIRIFPKPGIKLDNNQIKTEILGSRFMILIDNPRDMAKKEAQTLFVGPPQHLVPKSDVEKVENNIRIQTDSDSQINDSAIDPISEIRAEDTTPRTLAKGSKKIDESTKSEIWAGEGVVVKSTIFIALLIVASLVILTQRKFKMLRDIRQEDLKDSTIINLSSLHVSPKQKISLIQVGLERFLIGVTPTGVSLLTSLEKHQKEDHRKIEFGQRINPNIFAITNENDKPTGSKKFLEHLETADGGPLDRNGDILSNYVSPKISSEPKRESPASPKQTKSPGGIRESLKKEGRLQEKTQGPKRVRISIDDDGIRDLSPEKQISPIKEAHNKRYQNDSTGVDHKVIDDVTKLIRDRISGLRKI